MSIYNVDVSRAMLVTALLERGCGRFVIGDVGNAHGLPVDVEIDYPTAFTIRLIVLREQQRDSTILYKFVVGIPSPVLAKV